MGVWGYGDMGTWEYGEVKILFEYVEIRTLFLV